MNQRKEGSPGCYFHPREVVIGICALCLRERLLVLASKQGNHPISKDTTPRQRSFKDLAAKSTATVMPKVFALGSFLRRSESWRHRRKPDDYDEDSITSLDDSFISIKFEDNGRASWDKKHAAYNLPVDGTEGGKSVVEHRGGLRWRKRVGHLFKVLRWKTSIKPGSCHGVAETTVKGRRNWMRNLMNRRTTVAGM